MKEKIKNSIKQYTFMVIACFFYALSVNLFLVPNSIVAGGVAGLATLLHILTKLSVGIFVLAINIPILAWGIKTQGIRFILRCLLTTTVLSLSIDLLAYLPPLTNNNILAAIYAGALQGVAIGLFFVYSVSSGGTELLARILLRYFRGISLGTLLGIIDGTIVLLGSIVLKNSENVLVALIVIMVSAKVTDYIITGFDRSKMC